MVMKRGDKISFGDHVNRERIFSDYVERRGGDSLATRLGEEEIEKWPFSGQGEGEEVMRKSCSGLMERRRSEEKVS
jgi:hypothetical protein